MEPSKYEQKPQPGDLIEVFRDTYQHWALYIGDGYVIHLTSNLDNGFCSSGLSSTSEKAIVKKEALEKVVGSDKYKVNNLLDDKYKPRSKEEILQEANRFLGEVRPYSVLFRNCEHFVTGLRYGAPESRQALIAGLFGIIPAVCVAIFRRLITTGSEER